MNMITTAINWNVDPAIFQLGDREIRWYGLAFVIGFCIGYQIVKKMWKNENVNPDWLDPLLYFTVAGTIIGARLGHCLFYNPQYYLANPVEILKIWEGGLASHGGVLGIVLAIALYSAFVSHKSMLWTFDKLVVPTGLVAALIRIGNLMNHEIYGVPTGTDYGFKFITNLHAWRNGAEAVYTPPVHPTQLYEAAAYLLIFILCMWLYFKRDAWRKPGYIFGTFLATLFSARFIIEFFKEIQEPFEKDMTLNMGQLLSLPFIVAGVYFVARANKKGTGLRKRRNKESQPQVK